MYKAGVEGCGEGLGQAGTVSMVVCVDAKFSETEQVQCSPSILYCEVCVG